MEEKKRIEKEFESLSLEEKLSSLFRMEVATIREAVNYVAKDPMKIVDKIGEMIAEVGHRIENEFKNVRPTSEPESSQGEENKSKKHRPGKNSKADPNSI